MQESGGALTEGFTRDRGVTLKPLQLWYLRNFCDQHNIDYQEIDDSLTYSENMEHLNELAGFELDGQMEQWQSQEEFYDSVSLEEQGGLPQVDQIPIVPFYSLVYFKRREITRMRNFQRKFGKHIKLMLRAKTYHKGIEGLERTVKHSTGYAIFKGNIETIWTIINYIREQGLKLKVLKTSMKESFLRQYRYANGVWYKTSFD